MLDNLSNFLLKIKENIELFSNEQPSNSVGSEGLAEKINQLMPNIYVMIATLGALCILLLVLTKFLYKPVKKMVQRRKEFIQKNIDESIQAKKNAFDLENEARAKLQESKSLGNDLVAKAKIEAEAIKSQYIEQGKNEAERLIREAKDDIKAKKRSLEEESYNEIVSVAMEISEKIIKDKITEKEAKKYLDEYLGTR